MSNLIPAIKVKNISFYYGTTKAIEKVSIDIYHIHSLQSELTIAIVTHNMQQAARVSDFTAFFSTDESRIGQMVEFGATEQIFNNPLDPRTQDYISGRFG